jgi:hypothetical protein
MRCVHLKGAGNITTIGIDLGKNTFHLAGLDKRGAIAPQRKVSRRAPDPGAARQTVPQEHCRDAEAVAEAVQRPTMIFVLIKTRGKWICWLCIVCPRASSANGRGVWVGCRRLLRLPADRDDVRRRLPDLFIGQDISPGRHTEALLLSAIGNRLEDVLGVKLALRQIDAASGVFPMTMGTLLSQKEIMARRNHFRVFKIRNVLFRGRQLSNEDCRNDHHHKSARHGKHPDR